jgi:hypothetical protein
VHLAGIETRGDVMKVGDLVRNRNSESGELGLFMGMRTFVRKTRRPAQLVDYVCAEVMWLGRTAPNGDVISTIQTNLLEVFSEAPHPQQPGSPSNRRPPADGML